MRPFAFVESVMEYRFDQFITGDFGNRGPSIGTTVTFTKEDLITDRGLLLIRIITGRYNMYCMYVTIPIDAGSIIASYC